MVIITDANGNIQSPTIPENVYQGSNFANDIVFLAPLPQSNVATITFRLPNGQLLEEQPMTPYTDVPSEYNLSAWRFVLNDEVTQYYGQVTFQIYLYGASGNIWYINAEPKVDVSFSESANFKSNGQNFSSMSADGTDLYYGSTKVYDGLTSNWTDLAYRRVSFNQSFSNNTDALLVWLRANGEEEAPTLITSVAGTFPVLRGVPRIPHSMPSQASWQQICTWISTINASLAQLQNIVDNNWLESKGILPYDSTFTYSLGSSVFDKNTKTIYTSLQPNNYNNSLSNTDWWGKTVITGTTPAEVEALIEEHNTSNTAHTDIRNLIEANTTALNNKVDIEKTSNNFTSRIENNGDSVNILLSGDASGTEIETSLTASALVTGIQHQGTINNKVHRSSVLLMGNNLQLQVENQETNQLCTAEVKTDGLYVDNNKVETQNNKTSTITSLSTTTQYASAKGVYDFVSQNYVPITFASRLYLSKTGADTADLINTAPTPDNTNTLVVTSTNTSFDWSTPTITLTRTLETAIQLNNTNSFAVDLYFDLSRNTELTFGAKIKVSTDNGTTWTYISSNQSFGEKAYNSGFNSEDIVVYTDLATNETYPIGTLVAIELFKKQENNSSLTTTYYCGVEIDGANVYSFVEFNFANTRINTNQIEDGAVTYDKLGQDVKDMIADPLPSHTSADVGKVLTVDSNNEVVWDYTKDEFVMFTKTNSSGTFTVTSDDWARAMNNDKAILRVTDGTDYYVLYKVKYDATTVYFQGDGKEAQFVKDGVNYSGTFASLVLTNAEIDTIMDAILV